AAKLRRIVLSEDGRRPGGGAVVAIELVGENGGLPCRRPAATGQDATADDRDPPCSRGLQPRAPVVACSNWDGRLYRSVRDDRRGERRTRPDGRDPRDVVVARNRG